MQPHSRNNNFDLLRLILALAVVFSHSNGVYELGQESFIFNQGRLAVDSFFVISGFLITWSIDRGFSTKSYIIKRACRIYPLYFIVILLQFVFLYSFNSSDLSWKEPIKYLISNFSFLNFIKPYFGDTVSHAINGSLWTLKIEVAFYAILPLFLWFFRKLGWPFLLFSFIVALAYRYGFQVILENDKMAKQLPGAMTLFIIGIVLYFYGYKTKEYIFNNKNKNLLIFLVLAAYGVLIYLTTTHPLLSMISYHLLIGISVFIFVFHTPKLKMKYDISYGVYILHYPILVILNYFSLTEKGSFISLVIVIPTVIILAYATARWIEVPMINWGHKKAKKLN